MWRYLAGGAAMLVLIGAGVFVSREIAGIAAQVPPPPAAVGEPIAPGAVAPPRADEKSKEEKRFNRYDKDKNGAIAREEYLASRRKAYAKLDANGDGVLSFDEYAAKTREKFAKADADKSGVLNRAEFATTRPVRKAKPKCVCPPAGSAVPKAQPETSSDDADEA
jgi:hypothetical protein